MLAIALLVAVPLVLLGESILPGNVLASTGLDHLSPWSASATPEALALPRMNADTVRENLVYRLFIHDTVGQGEIPWWSPHLYTGTPFVALNHTQVLYPPTWLVARLDPFQAVGLLQLLHFIVAGTGMWFFTRAWGASSLAALLGALAWMLNGMFATRHGHPQFLATGCWLPWVCLGVHWLGQQRWGAGVGLVSASTAMLVLAGHPSIYVFGYYFVLVVLLIEFFSVGDEPPVRRSRWMYLAFGVAFLLGLALASTQLLATLELSSFSDRSERSYEALSEYLNHPIRLLGLWLPSVTGTPIDGDFWSPKSTSYLAGVVYTGLAPLLLAGVAVVRGARRERALGAVAVGVVAIMFVPVIFRLAWTVLPGFRFSVVDRLVVVWFLTVAVLAARGLDLLLALPRDDEAGPLPLSSWLTPFGIALLPLILATFVAWWWLPTWAAERGGWATARLQASGIWGDVGWTALLWCAAALIVSTARHPSWRRWGPPLLLTLTLVDLGSYASHFVVVRPSAGIFRDTPSLQWLQSQPAPVRIAKFNATGAPPWKTALPANVPLVYDLEDVHGFGPLHIQQINKLISAMGTKESHGPWTIQPFEDPNTLDSPVFDLLGAPWLVSDGPIDDTDFALRHQGDLWVYENEDALPPALFVPGYREIYSPRAAAALLGEQRVDPRQTVLIEQPPPVRRDTDPTLTGDNTVTLVSKERERMVLRKEGPDRGWILVTDAWYPGWRGWVGDTEVDVLRADGLFRTLPVPPGDHDVVLTYRPTTLDRSLVITAIALALWLVCLGVAVWQTRRRREAAA